MRLVGASTPKSQGLLVNSALGRALLLAGALAFAADAVQATPMYAGRSARTCDNCHVAPNEWVNPPVADRKCNMSCQSCHVDPAGGGLRNTAGRFFGQSTLPMIATSPRPTDDWDQNAPFLGRRDHATSYDDNLPLGPNTFVETAKDISTRYSKPSTMGGRGARRVESPIATGCCRGAMNA